jgi:RND superfamily putative drug exporter
VLRRIARLGIAAPRRVIGIAVLLMIVIGAFGTTVADKLSPSGFQDPSAESSRVAKLLTEKFGRGDVPLVIVVTAPDRYDSPQARAVATNAIDILEASGHVATVTSSSPGSSVPRAGNRPIPRSSPTRLPVNETVSWCAPAVPRW